MTLVVEASRRAAQSDVELVEAVAAGDRSALGQLYDRHADWLTARLERRCGDADLVDTAVQETFLAVWRQAADYRPTGEVGAWIWTIGLRRLIDQMRRRHPPEPVADVDRVVDEEVPLALGDSALASAFARLEPELQQVLAATALDGLTTKEAAVVLGIPRGTVKSRLARARRRLEELLP